MKIARPAASDGVESAVREVIKFVTLRDSQEWLKLIELKSRSSERKPVRHFMTRLGE